MATVGESSSTSPSQTTSFKQVVVRVKRKAFQSPVDAFWLEINERPLKRPLLDFGNLSISESSAKEELKTQKVLVQHVETLSCSEATVDIVQSFVGPDSVGSSECKSKGEERKHTFKKEDRQNKLLLKARERQEVSAKNARFQQIWKSRKGHKGDVQDNVLHEMYQFYDVVRVDDEGKSNEVQREEISLEDQRLLSSYLPLLREFIPNAAKEIESDIHDYIPKQEDFVYDFYTVKDDMDMNDVDSSIPFPQIPLVQVDDEDYYDGPDESDYGSDDSNAENNPLNDYPEEISGESEESENSDNDSEEHESESATNESSGQEGSEGHDFPSDADPLHDDDYCGVDDYDDGEDWRWSYR
ncbi:RNA-directed DNA methylation 4 [Quillaja saponaria]|uniref:RNA-directed DNA methylation 4 n=1 Tax=Quillaja saponaria TaxID=32244 RepID=A0AAD7LIZ5_QUISA|nr:RNA-directed DNA methylation 4 [Quillaja saponaria]